VEDDAKSNKMEEAGRKDAETPKDNRRENSVIKNDYRVGIHRQNIFCEI
jgi:hypothetical protein